MAYADLFGPTDWPAIPGFNAANAPSLGNVVVSANNAKVAFVFQAPKTGSIDRLSFLTASVTTGITVDVRLETVGADGFPSGSLVAANTNGSVTIADTDDNTWKTATLTSAASVSQGDKLALVVAFPGAGSFNLNLAVYADASVLGYPFVAVHNGTSYSLSSAGAPVGGVRYSTPEYPSVPSFYPMSAINTHTFNSTSDPDFYGNRYVMDFDCRAIGCWVWSDNDSPVALNLYSGSNVLTSVQMGPNEPPSTAAFLNMMTFTGSIDLRSGATYYLGVEPSTSTGMAVYSFDFDSTGQKSQLANFNHVDYVTSKDPATTGVFTVTNTRALVMGLLVSHIGASSGDAGGGAVTYHLGSFSSVS